MYLLKITFIVKYVERILRVNLLEELADEQIFKVPYLFCFPSALVFFTSVSTFVHHAFCGSLTGWGIRRMLRLKPVFSFVSIDGFSSHNFITVM